MTVGMILMYVGFGLMTGAAILLATANAKLHKKLDRLSAHNAEFICDNIDGQYSMMSKAEVEERKDGDVQYFAVFRRGLIKKVDVLRVRFNPNDPDDKEYRRIFAEERAEMLNEKP